MPKILASLRTLAAKGAQIATAHHIPPQGGHWLALGFFAKQQNYLPPTARSDQGIQSGPGRNFRQAG